MEKDANTLDRQWLDLSRLSLYLSNERTVLGDALFLFDKNGMFVDCPEKLESIGFEPFFFEKEYKLNGLMYRRQTSRTNEPLRSIDFTHELNLASSSISLVRRNLVEIQAEFRRAIASSTNQNFDSLLQTRVFLGFGSNNSIVYGTYYGRLVKQEDTAMSTTLINTINPEYLIVDPKMFDQIEMACRHMVAMSLKTKRAITLKSIIKIAAVFFQRKSVDFDFSENAVTEFQLRQIQDAIYFSYFRYLTTWGNHAEISTRPLSFDRADFNMITQSYLNLPAVRLDKKLSIIKNSELLPIEFLLNNHPTPAPIGMAAQMILIKGETPTSDTKTVLEPNFGYGALTFMLECHGFDVVGVENNTKITSLFGAQKLYQSVSCLDSITCNYKELHQDRPYGYTIANPPYQRLAQPQLLHTDRTTSIKYESNRTDFITVFKCLNARLAKGRSVFILRMESAHLAACTQLVEFLKVLELIYHVDAIIGIPSNLYSIFSNTHHVCMLVVNDKITDFKAKKPSIIEKTFKMVDSYISLWAWAESIYEKRSPEHRMLEKNYEYIHEKMEVLRHEYEELICAPIYEAESEDAKERDKYGITDNVLFAEKESISAEENMGAEMNINLEYNIGDDPNEVEREFITSNESAYKKLNNQVALIKRTSNSL